jgi:hypothetical protein
MFDRVVGMVVGSGEMRGGWGRLVRIFGVYVRM